MASSLIVHVLVLLAGFGLMCRPAYTQKVSEPHNATRIFHGAWFDIRFPTHFRASSVSKSTSSVSGSDEATFTSPDGRVQFYVFAPQWNGTSSFAVVRSGEKLVSQSHESRKDKSASYTTQVKWVTVEARNRAYTRTWEDVKTTLNTRRVFGVRYKTEADFRKYRSQYLSFKASLIQFTD